MKEEMPDKIWVTFYPDDDYGGECFFVDRTCMPPMDEGFVSHEYYNASNVTRLKDAAGKLIERWHTPAWKDAPATALYIEKLEKALEELK